MSGLSKLQRDILRLALAVNMHTQGGTARVKSGAPVDGYRVPTVDYAGPKDLRPPLLLWVFSDARLTDGMASGHFQHTRASKSTKASVTRAVTRLLARGLVVYAPLPKQSYKDRKLAWGYLLTAEGLKAAGATPLEVPMLAEALELFGVTHAEHDGWYPSDDPRHARKRQLVATLTATADKGALISGNRCLNGYRREGARTSATVDVTATAGALCDSGNRSNGYQVRRPARAVTIEATATAVAACDADTHCNGYRQEGAHLSVTVAEASA